MQIGFLTACMGKKSLAEIIQWAGENGVKRLEVAAKRGFLFERLQLTVEGELSAIESLHEEGEELAAKDTRKHLHGEEEALRRGDPA